jgi:hypothetical protein
VKPPASIESDEARRPTGADEGLRRRARAFTDGDARFVGSCEAEEIEIGPPQSAQKRADSGAREPQLGQGVKVSGF